MSNRRVIYTCITNNYDRVCSAPCVDGIDFVLFVDNLDMDAKGWELRMIDCDIRDGSSVNRFYKINAHLFLREYRESLYVDGNVCCKDSISSFFDQFTSNDFIAIYNHPKKKCAYEELKDVTKKGLVWGWESIRTASFFRLNGFPKNDGLFEANIIYRRHNEGVSVSFMKDWWLLWLKYLHRDQPLLSFIDWRYGGVIKNIGHSMIKEGKNEFFELEQHNKSKNRFPRSIRRLISEFLIFRIHF